MVEGDPEEAGAEVEAGAGKLCIFPAGQGHDFNWSSQFADKKGGRHLRVAASLLRGADTFEALARPR